MLFTAKVVKYTSLEIVRKETLESIGVEGLSIKCLYSVTSCAVLAKSLAFSVPLFPHYTKLEAH